MILDFTINVHYKNGIDTQKGQLRAYTTTPNSENLHLTMLGFVLQMHYPVYLLKTERKAGNYMSDLYIKYL